MSAPIWKPPAGAMREDQRIKAVEKILDGASPTVRRAIISMAIHADLEAAREAYARVYADDQKYKAALIRTNGKAVQGAAERLDAALETAQALLEVAVLAVKAASLVEGREAALRETMGQLAAVYGPWRDAAKGLEEGAGLSKYDTADGVERVQREARELHQRYMARTSKRSK